jgi:hypothetical protein
VHINVNAKSLSGFSEGLGNGGGERWLARPQSVKGLFDREHLRFAPDFAPAPAWAAMQG